MRRLLFSLVMLLAAGLLGACANSGAIRGRLHFGMDDAPEGNKLLWPAAPEVPRYLYTGTLIGEPNFQRDSAAQSALTSFGRWLTGLDDKPTPVVLQRPTVVTGDDAGRLYVSDTSRQAVFVFDETAGEMHVWELADAATRFVAPAGLAVAPGRLYVADAELGAVYQLALDGTPQRRIGSGLLKRPTGLARDPLSGRLFVADTMAHDVKVFSAEGQLLQTIGKRGEGDGEFNFPSHVAWAQGALYVTDTLNNRVQVFDSQGQVLPRKLGARGLFIGNLVRPKGVSVDSEGNVYVVESYYDSLLVYSSKGEFLLPIGGTGTATGRFYLPAGVWVDSKDRVHIADMFNGRIVMFQFLGGS